MKTRTYYHFTFQALMEVTTLIIFYQNHQPFKKIKKYEYMEHLVPLASGSTTAQHSAARTCLHLKF